MTTHTIQESKYLGPWLDAIKGYAERDPTYLNACKRKVGVGDGVDVGGVGVDVVDGGCGDCGVPGDGRRVGGADVIVVVVGGVSVLGRGVVDGVVDVSTVAVFMLFCCCCRRRCTGCNNRAHAHRITPHRTASHGMSAPPHQLPNEPSTTLHRHRPPPPPPPAPRFKPTGRETFQFHEDLPEGSPARSNIEQACVDTVFGARGVKLMNERGIAAMQDAGVAVVPAHGLVAGQAWATALEDGRHYPQLVPLELFLFLNTIEGLS